MAFYNLLGQPGNKGEINPDAPEAGPFIYEFPPGRGDNKGLQTTSFGTLGAADKKGHEKKLKEEGIEPETDQALANLSFAEREQPDTSKAIPNATNAEFRNINTLSDISELVKTKRLSDTQLNILRGQFGTDAVNYAISGAVFFPGTGVSTGGTINVFDTSGIDPGLLQAINNINEGQAAAKDLSNAEITRLLNEPFLQNAKTKAGRVKSIADEVMEEINQELEEAGGMTPAIINKLKNRDQEINTRATEIIVDLGINPNGLEGKAFAEGLKVGGAQAVENLFGKDRQPGEPMSLPVVDKDPLPFGWNEAKAFGVEYVVDTTVQPPSGGGPGGGPGGDGDPPPGDPPPGDPPPGSPPPGGAQQTNTDTYDFLNIPDDALLWNVDGNLFIVYQVPGDNGELYEGNPIFLAYDVQDNDLVEAGVLSPEAPDAVANFTLTQELFDSIAVVTGNTDQLTNLVENPFADFVETVGEQAQIAPWITDNEMVELIAEAAIENREVTDAEWQGTNWWQTHSETERDWLILFYGDPSTAAQTKTDAEIRLGNALQASGVSNAPESLINWMASKYVTGSWTENYTNEQITLFADPYAQGKRDKDFENYLSSTALTGVDRTTEKEREVEELFRTWLGPTLGTVTDTEKAEIAGKLRDDPEYKDTLISSLKQSRLAAFSAYTNPELTYDDIARPWRNLTTSVWGQTADETQGWWQDMVKSNDFTTAQTTLREKGLESNVAQVTNDASKALTQALGQGMISNTGVNT